MMRPAAIVVGGGIVGLATAREIQRRRPGARVLVLEKEGGPARHQTGRNSGVVHAGVYYRPGSLKATLCRRGKRLLESFVAESGVRHERCGKLVVATSESERSALHRLHERALGNGVDCRLVDRETARDIEPHVAAVEALHVPETGIVDYVGMAEALVREIEDRGGEVRCGVLVRMLRREGVRGIVEIDDDRLSADRIINCAGLQSDRLARGSGVAGDVRVVPFRGDYHVLRPEARHLCRGLVYPVPDPDFPFLGVHLTRTVDGDVECGPSAVLALAREGYGRASIRARDAWEILAWPGVHRLARRHWRTGWAEFRRAWSRRRFARSLQRLVPELEPGDLVPAPSGNRAQAVHRDGRLVDDFVVEVDGPMVHVVNAPSPAATASLAIAEHVHDLAFADRV